MKQLLKQLLALLHISVTRNQKYDACTRKIINQTLKPGSNCIDIGCHKGEILDLMIEGAPQGLKFAFEPIPELYRALVSKYGSMKGVTLHDMALYDREGETTFQHVLNAPAYSGIRKRRYDERHIEIEQITVKTGLLDQVIPRDVKIDLIKIDVEGAEYHVMRGGRELIRRHRPVIVFEFGLGAADYYNAKPQEVYSLLCEECGLKISTLCAFLKKQPSLTRQAFVSHFESGREYYFIAHP